MSDFVMTIGGDSVPAADSFGVVNPANGEVFAHAPECTRDQLDAAFDSAAKAQRDWKLDEAARRDTLLKLIWFIHRISSANIIGFLGFSLPPEVSIHNSDTEAENEVRRLGRYYRPRSVSGIRSFLLALENEQPRALIVE